jgi:hypothetical protein
MYIGEPQRVAAITPSCRNRAKPKSAAVAKEKHCFIAIQLSLITTYQFLA